MSDLPSIALAISTGSLALSTAVFAAVGARAMPRLAPAPAEVAEPSERPSTLFVLAGSGDRRGRWVEVPADVDCDCDGGEWVSLTTRCGQEATLHHCHTKAAQP